MSDYMAQQMDDQIEGSKHTYAEMREELEALRTKVAELTRELSEAKADAERYKVVRDGDHGEESGFVAVDGEALYGNKLDIYCDAYIAANTPVPGWKPECDPAIDAARKEEMN